MEAWDACQGLKKDIASKQRKRFLFQPRRRTDRARAREHGTPPVTREVLACFGVQVLPTRRLIPELLEHCTAERAADESACPRGARTCPSLLRKNVMRCVLLGGKKMAYVHTLAFFMFECNSKRKKDAESKEGLTARGSGGKKKRGFPSAHHPFVVATSYDLQPRSRATLFDSVNATVMQTHAFSQACSLVVVGLFSQHLQLKAGGFPIGKDQEEPFARRIRASQPRPTTACPVRWVFGSLSSQLFGFSIRNQHPPHAAVRTQIPALQFISPPSPPLMTNKDLAGGFPTLDNGSAPA
ncbi:hypothetical protein V8C26DRAFT_142060 [Trichoderma gracile]